MLLEKQLNQLLPYCSVLAQVAQSDNEEAWLQVRTKGIGGSDVGSIMGVNPWSSARQVFFNKTGQYQDKLEPNEASKERMHFGHVLEPVVASEFDSRTDGKYYTVEADMTFQSKDHPFLLANVDRFVIDSKTDEIVGLLECKTAGEFASEEWENGEVPPSYFYQVQHYLHVTGLKHAWIAALVGGNKFFMYDIFYDADLYTKHILPTLQKFWESNVLKLVEPELQSGDTEFVDDLWATAEVALEVTLGEEADDLADFIYNTNQQIKFLEKKRDAAKNQLKEMMQEAEIGYSSEWQITWSNRTRTGVDSNMLKEFYPEIYPQCLKTTKYRQMSFKKAVV